MKIRKGFVVREVAGNVVAVPTGDLVKEFNCIINLNKTAEFIWKLLSENDISIDEVVQKLVQEYKIDENKAKKDAQTYIEKLIEANIIEQ